LDENSPYLTLNKNYKDMLDSRAGKQPGNPRQIAQVLLHAAEHPHPPLHMIFGEPAIEWWQARVAGFSDPKFMQHFPHDKIELE
jgi:hypothetical protein